MFPAYSVKARNSSF